MNSWLLPQAKQHFHCVKETPAHIDIPKDKIFLTLLDIISLRLSSILHLLFLQCTQYANLLYAFNTQMTDNIFQLVQFTIKHTVQNAVSHNVMLNLPSTSITFTV